MRKLVVIVIAVLVVFAAGGRGTAAPQSGTRTILPLQLTDQIPVPHVAGRIDHFTADRKRRRLIFSALGNNTVEVIDIFAGRVVQSIPGLSLPQGVLYVPDFDLLFVANAGDGKVRVFDGANYELRRTIEVGEDPDNLRYDRVSKKVLVGFGDEGGGIATIDPASGELVGPIFKTGGHPESFQVDPTGRHIFVSVPDAGDVVESIDRRNGAVAKWPLRGTGQAYAMTMDDTGRRVFVISRKPPLMVVFDTESGREVARLPVAGGCDDVYFDSGRKRIYAIGAEGYISVFQQKDLDHYELISNVPSTISAKTGFFYETRDRLYVAVPAKGNEPAQVWTYEAQD